MASNAGNKGGRGGGRWRIAAWGTAALLLLVPLVAMRFTDEVNWTASDFVFAAAMFGSVGVVYELAVRMTPDLFYRAAVGVALASAFLLVWVNGAVGMIGSEGNPYNLLFGGVLAIALIGAIAARLKPAGMAYAMIAAGAAQAAVAAFGLGADRLGAVLSMAMAGSWLLAAWLFRLAAGREGTA